ncbi:MAG: hypothetical protein N3A57_07285, partial [Negativicutes bacterium]|nr:hypothetical protein [Negativicutes bacterium]
MRSAGFHAAIAFAVLLSGFTVGLTGSGEGTFRLGMTICAAASAGLNATEGGVAGNVDSVPAAGMSTGLPVAESGTNNEMTSSGGMSGAGRENSGVDGLNEVRKLKQLEVERIDGGRILKVELSKSKFEAAKLVLADLQGQFSGLDVVLLEGNDGKYMVLSGQSPEDVESLKDTLFFMLGIDENMPRFLVDISAVLKQYSNDEAENVGFPLVPSVVSATGAAAAVIPVGPNAQYGQTGPYMYSFQPATRWQVVTLYNNSALGKVMVGSNVLAQ